MLIFYLTSLINSIIQEHECRFYLSDDIKITLKTYFDVETQYAILFHLLRNVEIDVIM